MSADSQDVPPSAKADRTLDTIDPVCDAFEAVWQAGNRPRIEDFLDQTPERYRPALLSELVRIDIDWRRRAGESPDWAEYAERFSLPEPPAHTAKTALSSLGDQTSPPPSDPDATARPQAAAASPGAYVLNPAAGTLVDQYRLDQKLGEGGMGAVWKAFHVRLDKYVALKLLPPELTRNATLVARFDREMKAVAKIDHPNVVRAMDAGEYQGLHYLVMEYVDGVDLSDFVKARGPQPVRNACELIRQAALGLAAAHKLGLVHRDIKPSNLFLTKPKDGAPSVVKILDLGLARLTGDTPANDPGAGLTGTGNIMGTPDYMAPEQCEDTHHVDARADLYSLGCTLFHLLTGRPPYGDAAHASLARKIVAHTHEPIPDLRAARLAAQGAGVGSRGSGEEKDSFIPDAVVALYQRLMAKKPEERVQTADELASALLTIVKTLGSGGQSAVAAASPPASAPAAPHSPATAPTETFNAPASAGNQKAAERKNKPAGPDDDGRLEQSLKAQLPTPPRTSDRKTANATAKAGPTAKSGQRPGSGLTSKIWIAAGALAAVVLLAGLIIKIKNNDGTTTEERSGSRQTSDESRSTSRSDLPSDRSLTTSATKAAAWHGWPADAPKPAVAPFDAAQARKHQEEWAAYLKVPVEHTNSLGMKFVLIPPGEFTMGSTPEEIEETLKVVGDDKRWQECVKSEAPRHKVILTQPIYLGVNEVTQAEYEKVMGKNPSWFAKTGPEKQWVEKVEGLDTSTHPVENVSWTDAAEFCAKLSQQEKLKPFYFRAGETVTPLDGTGYRLPTEAEWEFSCRAGTTTKFWIGDTENDLLKAGWFGQNSGGRTHAAGELRANPFGLFDIHGNVYEWVEDAWDPTWYGRFQEKPANNPNCPYSAGSQRVLRGGHWLNPAFRCRSSPRLADNPSDRSDYVGFRVSLVAVGPRAGR